MTTISNRIGVPMAGGVWTRIECDYCDQSTHIYKLPDDQEHRTIRTTDGWRIVSDSYWPTETLCPSCASNWDTYQRRHPTAQNQLAVMIDPHLSTDAEAATLLSTLREKRQ